MNSLISSKVRYIRAQPWLCLNDTDIFNVDGKVDPILLGRNHCGFSVKIPGEMFSNVRKSRYCEFKIANSPQPWEDSLSVVMNGLGEIV